MAEAVKVTTAQTLGAGSLGSQLDQLDNLIGRIGLGDKKNALAVLTLMDQINTQFRELREQGAAIKAEESQFESCSAALYKEAHRLVREIGGEAALRDERELRKPPKSAWWWFLDGYLAQKKSAAFKNGLKVTVVVVLVVAILVIAYQLFLAPSPEVVARYEAINQSQMQALNGKYVDALASIQKGLAAVPDDPELLIMQGIVYSLQENQGQADSSFATAKAKLNNDEMFYIAQSQDYLTINQPKLGEQSARAAIKANPNSAKGYFLLGSAQELEGNSAAAIDSYTKTVQYAEAAGDSNTSVQAKIKMGYLMQAAGLPPDGTPPATGTP